MSTDSEPDPIDGTRIDPDPDIQVAHQARFAQDGEVTTVGGVTATSLVDFGPDVDDRGPQSRLDKPGPPQDGTGYSDNHSPRLRGPHPSDQALGLRGFNVQ